MRARGRKEVSTTGRFSSLLFSSLGGGEPDRLRISRTTTKCMRKRQRPLLTNRTLGAFDVSWASSLSEIYTGETQPSRPAVHFGCHGAITMEDMRTDGRRARCPKAEVPLGELSGLALSRFCFGFEVSEFLRSSAFGFKGLNADKPAK